MRKYAYHRHNVQEPRRRPDLLARLDQQMPLPFELSPTLNINQLLRVSTLRTISECLKALESDPRTASASDYKELAPIALDLAIAYAKDSQAFVTGLIKTNPSEAIKQCADAYRLAMLAFQSAKMELNEDPMTANYDITMAVIDDIHLCETWLKQGGVQVPEISSINNGLYLYRSIGGVITDNLY
ncbi:hypothetical protein ACLB2K_011439 [Fragaria x ananassa]